MKVFQEKSTYIVVIKDITLDYAGEVVCKAVNEYGEASSSARLTISPRGTPPDFTEWLSNVTAKEGATIKHKGMLASTEFALANWNDLASFQWSSRAILHQRSPGTSTTKK